MMRSGGCGGVWAAAVALALVAGFGRRGGGG